MTDSANFYLYFPNESGAQAAASELRDRGYAVDVRLGADDQNWLAFASRLVTDDALDEAEEELIEVAESLGGEFDGYDRP